MISNAEEVNPNAFWDMYACCPGHGIEASGYSFGEEGESEAGICMVQCRIGKGESTTWQEVGECLQKRVKEVVCAPRYEERFSSYTDGDAETSEGVSGSSVAVSSGKETGSASASASASASTGAGSRGVVHVGSVKVGLFTFGLLALGSAAGMFL